jgi:beta-glucosidase
MTARTTALPPRVALISALLGTLPVVAPAAVGVAPSPPEEALPWRDPARPVDARVHDLISRMTLEEKASQLMDSAPAIPRLSLPAYEYWSEALHGVANSGTATVFPQSIGLAATFHPDLLLRVSTVIGDEARAKYAEALARVGRVERFHGLTMFSPNVNLFRDPRWGRGQETYGEDPYLTSRLGIAFVRGIQGDDPLYLKVAATAKHYAVHSGPEPERHRFDAKVSIKDMRETYLPAFEALVREGGVSSVMCAYNAVNGQPACASEDLLYRFLRGEWGFEGYVVSDCDAVNNIWRESDHAYVATPAEAAGIAVGRGTDLECGEDYRSLADAVRKGLVGEKEVDRALVRVLSSRFRLGLFDPPERVRWAAIRPETNDSRENRQLSLEAARESIVVLKNDGLLPLKKTVRTVAVVGPNADDVPVLLGNYNGWPSRAVTPYQGMKAKLPKASVILARGTSLTGRDGSAIPSGVLSPPGARPGEHGLKGEYFTNMTLEGEPKVVRLDGNVDFAWHGDPAPGLPREGFSVRWTGTLAPKTSGEYALGFTGDDGYRVWLDGQPIVEDWTDHAPTPASRRLELRAGRAYGIRVEFYQNRGGVVARLEWEAPGQAERLRRRAVAAAQKADVVVAVMGIAPSLEGEEMKVEAEGFSGGDRTDIGLPRVQQQLLERLVATGKPVVLVLLSGSPLAVPWAAEMVPAIVQLWYPGEEGGTALADVLWGDYNPAGRLPVTFLRSVDQLPPFTDYSMDGRTYRFFKGEPLFPFGFGLSYTRFEYSALAVPPRAEVNAPVEVSVAVRNVGGRDGDEVVQLYVSHVGATTRVPLRSLQGMRRLHLNAGEQQKVVFTLEPRQLAIVNDTGQVRVEPGRVAITVGGKQPGFSGLADAATTQVVAAETDLVGRAATLVP